MESKYRLYVGTNYMKTLKTEDWTQGTMNLTQIWKTQAKQHNWDTIRTKKKPQQDGKGILFTLSASFAYKFLVCKNNNLISGHYYYGVACYTDLGFFFNDIANYFNSTVLAQ